MSNYIAEDILSHYNDKKKNDNNVEENFVAEDILMHYGTKRHSGRYPWGSGDDPYQHSGDFYSRVQGLKKEGLKEKEIADMMGLSTTDLRAYIGIAKTERRMLLAERARSLKEDGLSTYKIGEIMGVPESTVRTYLDDSRDARWNSLRVNADYLKKQVAEKGMIDIGAGVERQLNMSKEQMEQVIAVLTAEGYPVYGAGVPQATNKGKQTNLRVLCPPGTENKAIYNFEDIHSLHDYTLEGIEAGETSREGFKFPSSMDSSRIKIRYKDEVGPDGHVGEERDGVVELRRGVKDLNLGDSNYAQVRIMVDGTHYIKGMAVYSDNLPDGVDAVFNTNKPTGTPMCGDKNNTVLKLLKRDSEGNVDPDNPFGSLIKENGGQSEYLDADGQKKLSLINKRADEGDWGEWADKLPSQFLSKQNITMIKKQLKIAEDDKVAEFNDICELTNPTVKRKMLESFADDCDAAAVHLKAAALPRQKYQVILPIPDMKNDEIYAPNYEDGEKVALVRYPHGGTFEIPILTVNNKVASARKTIGPNPKDAIGINSEVAGILSGADFDGDTCMVIPTSGNGKNPGVNISSRKPFDGLKNFNPKAAYPEVPGMRIMKNTQNEMGRISNLITDMTLKGATDDELERAVRHSMVVIDAEKHRLNYKLSEKDNDIASLKRRYQGHVNENGKYSEGASTLISKASSKKTVLKRKGNGNINAETGELSWEAIEYTDPKTGKLVYKPSKIPGETYEVIKYKDPQTGKLVKATGDTLKKYYRDKQEGKNLDNYKVTIKERTQDSTKMAEAKDARTLSSGTVQEEAYANYANKMKSLANQARKEMIATGRLVYNKAASITYKAEVDELNRKLKVSEMNAPKERKAQLMANAEIKAKKEANPDITSKEEKKIATKALIKARLKVGARRHSIDITEREWEAIQNGAISDTTLLSILNHTDGDTIKKYATPRKSNELSIGQKARLKSLLAMGYTNAQIAQSLGVSTSTINKYS